MASKTDYQINDSELVLYVRENNEDAKEELYNKYVPLLRKEIFRYKKRAKMLGIDEDDLSQEAMLAFSRAINNYSEDESKFITFATICVRRRLANYVDKFDTKKSKFLEKSIPLDANMDENVTYMDQLEDFHLTDPLKRLINTETLDETLQKVLHVLSVNELVALKYDLEGKSVNDIATLMERSPKQIYNLIHRARSKIKQKK